MSKYSDVLEKFLDFQRRSSDRPNEEELLKIHEDAKPYTEDFLREGFEPESLIKILGFETILDHSDLADENVLDLARKKWVRKNIKAVLKNDFKNLPYNITPTFVAKNCDERYLHDLAEDCMLIESYVDEGGDSKVLFDRVVEVYGYKDYDVIATVITYGSVSEFDEDKLRESFAEAKLVDANKDYYAQLLTVSGYWSYDDAEKIASGKLY